MARFSRHAVEDAPWAESLRPRFTLAELMTAAPAGEFPAALAWLYGAIEHGRVEPRLDPDGMAYAFVAPGQPSGPGTGADASPATA
jgi:hypothetical protein